MLTIPGWTMVLKPYLLSCASWLGVMSNLRATVLRVSPSSTVYSSVPGGRCWPPNGAGRGEGRGGEGRGGEGRGGEGRDGSATHIPAGDKPSVVVVPRTSCDKALPRSGSQLRETYLHV